MNGSAGNASNVPTIVGLGEILWDLFPDSARFGGAPANFACSVAGLAPTEVRAAIVSAVGTDPLGDQALEVLVDRGVDTSCVARLPQATGQVLVELDAEGRASYRFADDGAWDNLSWSDRIAACAAETAAVCFGTLGQRSTPARETIRQFVTCVPSQALRILDLNLRSPHWDEGTVLESLELANVLKLNDQELPVVGRLLGWEANEHQLLSRLVEHYRLEAAALTRGDRGSCVVTRSGAISDLAGTPVRIADTVGAGDAFTAALALGLVERLPLEAVHRWAERVATFVCSCPGATPVIPPELCFKPVRDSARRN